MPFRSVNPATGRELRTYEALSDREADERLGLAVRAQRAWVDVPFDERAARLRAAGELLRARADDLARLAAEEMGKPLGQGRKEAEKCATACDWFAEHGEGLLADEPVETEALRSYVAHRPLGVVLAIMPWNFPYWQVFRFAAPALMAGNGALVKHAPNVPGCAAAIEDVLREAGFPEHLYVDLRVEAERVAGLLERREIAAVTLTGSTRAGRSVAEAAGRNLKKSVLELGGSDAYVVLEDADLDATVEACVTSRLLNSGQSCIAAKRFVAVDAVRDAFTERFVEAMRGRRFGDPLADEDVDLGPLARADLRDELHRQVRASVDAGAELLLGGEPPDGPGAFYPPTVLAGVREGMPAYDEETFGPVASILPARDEDDAIRIANDTAYGLGAAVFTRDVARGERIAADRLAAGSCCVNDFVRSDPRLPFGGIRESGYGRELAGQGIREFVNVKTVYVGRS